MTNFKAGQEYPMRDGGRARIYVTDAGGEYPIHGAIHRKEKDTWFPMCWAKNGERFSKKKESDYDLMPEPREYWVNLYDLGDVYAHKSEKAAIEGARTGLGEIVAETIHVREVLDNE